MSKPPATAQLIFDSANCCIDSCCARCTSTIEKSISERIKQLVAGRDLAQKMHQSSIVGRLSCLPLTETSYRFLKYQFRIVENYLMENDVKDPGNRWGAVFHLRMIGARIRSARASLVNVARDCA